MSTSCMLETGFEVYILMRQLSDRIPSFEARMQPHEGDPVFTVQRVAFVRNTRATYSEALSFFAKHCRRIEIVRRGNLERFYFAEPPMCQHLTARTRDYVKWNVNRESSHKRTRDFFRRHEELLEEMRQCVYGVVGWLCSCFGFSLLVCWMKRVRVGGCQVQPAMVASHVQEDQAQCHQQRGNAVEACILRPGGRH